jgi:hypothetical protein
MFRTVKLRSVYCFADKTSIFIATSFYRFDQHFNSFPTFLTCLINFPVPAYRSTLKREAADCSETFGSFY